MKARRREIEAKTTEERTAEFVEEITRKRYVWDRNGSPVEVGDVLDIFAGDRWEARGTVVDRKGSSALVEWNDGKTTAVVAETISKSCAKVRVTVELDLPALEWLETLALVALYGGEGVKEAIDANLDGDLTLDTSKIKSAFDSLKFARREEVEGTTGFES